MKKVESAKLVPEYIKRIIKEKEELDKKVNGLSIFLKKEESCESNFLTKEKFGLMTKQLFLMKNYSIVLGERLKLEI